MSGESENWEVKSFPILMTSEKINVGNATLIMKNTTEYTTNFTKLQVFAVIDNEDILIHAKQATVTGTGVELDIVKMTVGEAENRTFLKKDGSQIEFDDIHNIYMTIELQDLAKNEKIEERIDLYHSSGR